MKKGELAARLGAAAADERAVASMYADACEPLKKGDEKRAFALLRQMEAESKGYAAELERLAQKVGGSDQYDL